MSCKRYSNSKMDGYVDRENTLQIDRLIEIYEDTLEAGYLDPKMCQKVYL